MAAPSVNATMRIGHICWCLIIQDPDKVERLLPEDDHDTAGASELGAGETGPPPSSDTPDVS